MRYLFVYQDFATPARDLVSRLGVSDVTVIVARKGEMQPSDEELERIGDGRPPSAACQVLRKFRQAIEPIVDLQYQSKQFRVEDKQLEAWLLDAGSQKPQENIPTPHEAFEACVKDCPQLLLAVNALSRAREIDPARWPFIQKASLLLARYAKGEPVGPMREWKARYGVEFAPNGRVSFRGGAKGSVTSTEWHLKEGDRTTAELAARVYFDMVDHEDAEVVVVFYVGPHPPDGTYPWTLA